MSSISISKKLLTVYHIKNYWHSGKFVEMVPWIPVQQIPTCLYNSSTLPVISGVPLGSLLGPPLFLIYINDLLSSVKHTSSFLFADDTSCLHPICSPQDCIQLQSDLDALSSWSTDWKLMFNETKINVFSFPLSPATHLLNKVNTSILLTNYQSHQAISKRSWHYDIYRTILVSPCI